MTGYTSVDSRDVQWIISTFLLFVLEDLKKIITIITIASQGSPCEKFLAFHECRSGVTGLAIAHRCIQTCPHGLSEY